MSSIRRLRSGVASLLVAAALVVTPFGAAFASDDPPSASDAEAGEDPGAITASAAEEEEKNGFWERLKDPEYGKLDLTAGTGKGQGFFPLGIPFNEPALGFGLGIDVAGGPEESVAYLTIGSAW